MKLSTLNISVLTMLPMKQFSSMDKYPSPREIKMG